MVDDVYACCTSIHYQYNRISQQAKADSTVE